MAYDDSVVGEVGIKMKVHSTYSKVPSDFFNTHSLIR